MEIIDHGEAVPFWFGADFLAMLAEKFPNAGDFVILPAATFQLLMTEAAERGLRREVVVVSIRIPE